MQEPSKPLGEVGMPGDTPCKGPHHKQAAAHIKGIAHQNPVLKSESFDIHGKMFFFQS
jgi:hypothetical protein